MQVKIPRDLSKEKQLYGNKKNKLSNYFHSTSSTEYTGTMS